MEKKLDEHVQSQIDHLPGGRVSTKVTIGAPGRQHVRHSPAWRRASQRRQDQELRQINPVPGPNPGTVSAVYPGQKQKPGHGRRQANISQSKRNLPFERGTSTPNIREGASFSEIMGDLLVGKPPIPGMRRTG